MGTILKVTLAIHVLLAISIAQDTDTVLVEDYSFGSFKRATRIVSSIKGKIYVIDADKNQLILIGEDNKQKESVGGFGWSDGSFDMPTGVATDGVNIYASDYGNHRIQRFDRNLNYISSLYTRDTADISYRFGYPMDIALSEFGDLFVIDGENLRVLKFSSLHFYERSFGDINSGKGKLDNPIRLVVTTSRIFVGETNRIAVFDYFGNYLGCIGEGIVNNLCGFTMLSDGLLAVSNEKLWWFSKDGELNKTSSLKYIITSEHLEKIQDVAFDGKRLLILTPQKILVFKSNR